MSNGRVFLVKDLISRSFEWLLAINLWVIGLYGFLPAEVYDVYYSLYSANGKIDMLVATTLLLISGVAMVGVVMNKRFLRVHTLIWILVLYLALTVVAIVDGGWYDPAWIAPLTGSLMATVLRVNLWLRADVQ